jgi:hypothetical protein
MAQRTAGPPRSGAIQDQCQREGRFERVEQPMPWFLYSRGAAATKPAAGAGAGQNLLPRRRSLRRSRRRGTAVGDNMTDEEKKRIALEALFQLDDELGAKVDHDRTIIVAALLEHAVGEPPSRRGDRRRRGRLSTRLLRLPSLRRKPLKADSENDAYRHMQGSGVSWLKLLGRHPFKAETAAQGRSQPRGQRRRARLCANTAIASPCYGRYGSRVDSIALNLFSRKSMPSKHHAGKGFCNRRRSAVPPRRAAKLAIPVMAKLL